MSKTGTNESGYAGQQQSNAAASRFNSTVFLFEQLMAGTATATVVVVKAVRAQGAFPAPCFVDLQPLVKQIDGQGNVTSHGIINNVPASRVQGGSMAVVLDPQAGDIGIAVFASRDISSVKSAKAEAPPGSRRQYDYADGLYVGGVLNGVPTCYLAFLDADNGGPGMTMTPDEGVTSITITAGKIRLVAAEVDVHATTILKYDANGNGTHITTNTRTDYVIGSANSTAPLHPPEVP